MEVWLKDEDFEKYGFVPTNKNKSEYMRGDVCLKWYPMDHWHCQRKDEEHKGRLPGSRFYTKEGLEYAMLEIFNEPLER